MSAAKKKAEKAPAMDAVDAAADQFASAADMVKSSFDAALDAGAEQARAACAFEGVEFAGRENVDAALKAGEAYYAGLKDLSDLWFKTAKDAARFNSDAVKALSGCKTPQDLSQAQMKIATESFEVVMANANTFGEKASKVVGDVVTPLSAPLNAPFAGQFTGPFAQFWNKSAA
jgi:hypothetical protein